MPLTLLRHIEACNNVHLPAGRLRFHLGDHAVGWVLPGFAERLRAAGLACDGRDVRLADPAALPALARDLAEAGAFRWRGEAFDVRTQSGAVVGQVDRGALPCFGIGATGVHMNGLVRRPAGLAIWVARRAPDKALDPGKLDHIAAGGVPAGLTPDETMVKEAGEEAAIPAALARTARHRGVLGYVMQRDEGLRRDRLHCYDLDLDESFTPRPNDGEVAGFELWPAPQVLEALRDGEAFKFNVPLVLLGLLLRERLIDPDGDEGRSLSAALAALPHDA